MSQINFRLNEEDTKIFKEIAKKEGRTLTYLARNAFMMHMREERVNFAFEYLREGKIGFKEAFKMSGLTYHEFMLEWAKRDAKEQIPNEIVEEHLKNALNFDIVKYLKKNE